jgi:hypothetical protein
VIADRNKTEITRLVTAAVMRYFDEHGCKPLETEVPICDGWVADVAGVINPTQTELVELKLIKRRPRYRDYSEAAQQEQRAWYDEVKQAQKLMTVLCEVKTSRSDFRGDKKWELRIPANLAYLAIPKDLPVSMDEIPLAWGVLEYLPASDSIRCIRVPAVNEVTTEQQLSITLQVAVRRDHHTRYERHREFQKQMVKAHNEDISRTRVSVALRAMTSVVTGKCGPVPHDSVEGALEYHGIKHVTEYDMDKLRKLWKIAEVKP